MSREIKFRAWDRYKERMGEIDKFHLKDKECSLILDNGDKVIHFYYDEIDIMQYTGLKDKNRKEIYEGDILSIKIYSGDKVIVEGKTVVEFKDGCFGVIWGHDKAFLSLNSFFKAKFEVIGNIYENPELLRSEE